MNLSRNNILTIVLVLVLLATAYIWYAYLSGNSSGSAVGTAGGANVIGTQSNEFLGLLNVLKGIKMDTAFFDDTLFKNLKDATTLEDLGAPGQAGRPNPFQPLR